MIDEQRPSSRFITGLDLGQVNDFTALAVLEQTLIDSSDVPHRWTYSVRHLERFQLGTSYPDIVARVGEIISAPTLQQSVLATDKTGVGQAVVDMLRGARLNAYQYGINITAGTTCQGSTPRFRAFVAHE